MPQWRYDWDAVIERRNTDSMKWARYADRNMLPLWVADMDFAAPPAVIEALQQRVAHGVFGYAIETPALQQTVVDYVQRHYGWSISPEWLVWLPGLVTGLNVMCRAIDGPVFTATPVYPPFMSAPHNWQRPLHTHLLVQTASGWEWDFAAVDAALAASKAKLWLLCHPHNPVGRAWRTDELAEIARLAAKHDVTVCSDEIHCDLLLDPAARHTPFAMVDEDAAARSVTLLAPSKTFNIPGLGAALAVIPDAQLRRRFSQAMQGIVPHVNLLGLAATQAALTDCDDWLGELRAYLRGNALWLESQINALPGLHMTPVEATYLAWIDASALCHARGIDNPQRWLEQAGLGLSAGRDFAPQCAQFVRLNFGCPRTTLEAAVARLRAALA